MLELLKHIGEFIIGSCVCLFLLFFVFAEIIHDYCRKHVDKQPNEDKNDLSE